MAKNSIRDYSATNSSNTDIQSIDISEGCSPAGINNAIREVMADLKDVSTGAVALESPSADSLTVTAGLTVDNNGATVATFDRATSDGTIIDFQKSGTTVGSIGTTSSKLTIGSGATGVRFNYAGIDTIAPWNVSTNALTDGTTSLGYSNTRFKDLYLSGGVYLGGTGSANYLDDYEEGTWTPTCAQATITVQTANYTKIGRLVHLQFYVTVSNATASAMTIAGLPFTNISNGWAASVLSNGGTSSNVKMGRVYAGGTSIQILDGTDANVLANAVGGFIVLQVTYLTNA